MVPENPRATSIRFTDDRMVVDLEDGREVSVPLEWFPRLRNASPTERDHYRLMGGGVGIHWPELDEDLSVRGLLTPSVDHVGTARRRTRSSAVPPESLPG
jgi:hypothetical protein